MLWLSELGNRLKQAREERKLSLDDLQAITKIQKRYLLGIEEGNYGMMPGNFYVRAFIKQYAEAVGLDPEKLFDEYKNEIPIVHTEETIELSRVKTHKELPKSASKVLEFLPRILIIAVVILAAVIIWITVQNKPDSSGQADQPKQTSSGENEYDAIESPEEPEPKETDAGSAPAEEDKPAEEKPAEPASEVVFKETAGRKAVYELTKAEQFKLDVTSSGTTWIEIRNASGKKFFSGMLNKGKTESHDFTNETEAFIVIGNASAAQIKVNGKPVEYKIDPKKTVRQDMQIVYTKE
ncbi:RodZ family helix-turn-helix domain-containing protein [Metabacillus indicus]|nr:RodZ family helix-turn-helix domain-containing protein [Metabacillus indicus]MDX8288431.1 RodZ family helix-turn-helix domain-containing protein [Metabacillus indicus]